MTRQLCIIVSLVVFLGVALTPRAAQARTTAPPGNSGIDEYVEAVPDADGDRPASGGGGGAGSNSTGGGGSGGGLSPGAREGLESQGADGRATASALAGLPGGSDQTTANTPSDGRKSDGRSTRSTDAGKQLGADSSGSPISAILRAATGSDKGMGIALPLILLVALIAAAGFMIRRHGRSSA